jgi:hypothetical protein
MNVSPPDPKHLHVFTASFELAASQNAVEHGADGRPGSPLWADRWTHVRDSLKALTELGGRP